MRLLTAKDVATLYDFIVASAQRFYYFFQSPHQNPLFIYFLTFSFPKHRRGWYYTLKYALNYVALIDRNALVLARKEPYADKAGYHVHVLLLMNRSINFRKFKSYAYRKTNDSFVLHVERINPTLDDYVNVLRYMYKNEKRPEILQLINDTKNIILNLHSLWRNFFEK